MQEGVKATDGAVTLGVLLTVIFQLILKRSVSYTTGTFFQICVEMRQGAVGGV